MEVNGHQNSLVTSKVTDWSDISDTPHNSFNAYSWFSTTMLLSWNSLHIRILKIQPMYVAQESLCLSPVDVSSLQRQAVSSFSPSCWCSGPSLALTRPAGSDTRDSVLHHPEPATARCPSAMLWRGHGGHTVHIAPEQMHLSVVPEINVKDKQETIRISSFH